MSDSPLITDDSPVWESEKCFAMASVLMVTVLAIVSLALATCHIGHTFVMLGIFIGLVSIDGILFWKIFSVNIARGVKPVPFDFELPETELNGLISDSTIQSVFDDASYTKKWFAICMLALPACLNVTGAIFAVVRLSLFSPKSFRDTMELFDYILPCCELTIICGIVVFLLCRLVMLRTRSGWLAVLSLDLAIMGTKCIGAMSAFALIGPIPFMFMNVSTHRGRVALIYFIGGCMFLVLGTAAFVVKIRSIAFLANTMIFEMTFIEWITCGRTMQNIIHIEHDHWTLLYPAGVHRLKVAGDMLALQVCPHVGHTFRYGIFAKVSQIYGGMRSVFLLATMDSNDVEKLLNAKRNR